MEYIAVTAWLIGGLGVLSVNLYYVIKMFRSVVWGNDVKYMGIIVLAIGVPVAAGTDLHNIAYVLHNILY